jgi:hypothetical protein
MTTLIFFTIEQSSGSIRSVGPLFADPENAQAIAKNSCLDHLRRFPLDTVKYKIISQEVTETVLKTGRYPEK